MRESQAHKLANFDLGDKFVNLDPVDKFVNLNVCPPNLRPGSRKKNVNFAPAEKFVNLNVGPFQSPNFFQTKFTT